MGLLDKDYKTTVFKMLQVLKEDIDKDRKMIHEKVRISIKR